MLSFLTSIQKARPPHNNSNAKNPAKKAFHDLWCINSAVINAAIAIVHQGKYMHPIKDNKAVTISATINFIKYFKDSGFACKTSNPADYMATNL